MKKTVVAFVLGGFITAGAFAISYGLPITSAAEKAASINAVEAMPQQCTEIMKNPAMQSMMNSMIPAADSKAADPKAVEDMTQQCTEMMKNPRMQTMMKSLQTKDTP